MSDLKRLIDEKGISQNELARRIGVSKSSISRIISGAQVPKAPLAIKIADILGTDVRELCGAVEAVEALPSKNLQPTCNQLATDLISRQAAIDAFYIQSDDNGCWTGTAEDMENLLKALPSAQPEIIYCKDCKYCSYDSIFDQSWCNHTSGVRKVKPTDFCSCGRGRTNEGSDRKTGGD